MSKPPGLEIGMSLDRTPMMRVRSPSQVEDKLWEAVEAAICAGWSARQIRNEVAEAWRHVHEEEAREGYKEITK